MWFRTRGWNKKYCIFMVGMQSEQAIEMKNDLYPGFMDYTNVFDKA